MSNLYTSENEHSSMYMKTSKHSLMNALQLTTLKTVVFDLFQVHISVTSKYAIMNKSIKNKNDMLLTRVLP